MCRLRLHFEHAGVAPCGVAKEKAWDGYARLRNAAIFVVGDGGELEFFGLGAAGFELYAGGFGQAAELFDDAGIGVDDVLGADEAVEAADGDADPQGRTQPG